MNCLFCGIAAGTIPAAIIYQDDTVVAFRDIHPQAPTHILVIPRRHIATVNDLGEEETQLAGRLLLTARRIAADLGFADDGYRLVMNTNANGGQTVFHIHLHLLAGRQCHWPPG